MKRLDRAQLKVLFNAPFFASGVARLPVVFDPGVKTATTNGECIKWNPEWFDKLDDQQLVTVYCEEVGHCMLGHLWRKPAGSEDEDWFKACDAAVRCMMDAFGKYKTDKGMANPFPFPPEVLDQLNHSAYNDMAEEKIYKMLAASKPKGPKGKNPPGGGGGGGGFAEFENKDKNDSGQKKQENNWQNVMIQSVHAAKQRGQVPGNIERMIDEMLTPEVPWQEVLRALLREMANDDWNFMKPDIMLSDSTGFIMPSLESEKMGSVVFAIDTSGSIDHKMLADFKTEEQACLDDMKPESILEICCDTKIHRVIEFRRGQQVDNKAPGGGGTDFSPVFAHCAELPKMPKAMVFLTDLQGSFPAQEPPYPVIWIVYGDPSKTMKAPFGDTVHVG
jgi:predicted metal-dependent peptidase